MDTVKQRLDEYIQRLRGRLDAASHHAGFRDDPAIEISTLILEDLESVLHGEPTHWYRQ